MNAVAPDEIRYEIRPDLARRLARRFLLRKWALAFLILGGIAAAAVVLETLAFTLGTIEWLDGVLIGALGMFALMMLCTFVVYERRAGRSFAALRGGLLTARFDRDCIAFSSPVGSSSTPWSAVREVWRFPEAWLIFFVSRDAYTAIPTDAMSASVQEYVLDRVSENGGRVR